MAAHVATKFNCFNFQTFFSRSVFVDGQFERSVVGLHF
jgi:hypothetical protein